MGGRYRWHRHPKAVVEEEGEPPAPGVAPPPEPPFVEGPSYQFQDAMNSMYIAVGI